jgi:multiple sugar transport system permease protein
MLAYVLNRFKFHGNTIIAILPVRHHDPRIATQVTVYQIMTASVSSIRFTATSSCSGERCHLDLYFPSVLRESVRITDESAILDGCNYFGVFFKILLPLTKPRL